MNKEAKKMMKENEALETRLKGEEYTQAATDIIVYLRCSNISVNNQEKVRSDILQMLIDGEERGMSVREVIGEDYKEFCDQVITEVPKLTKGRRIATAIKDVLPAVAILLLCWFVFDFAEIISEVGMNAMTMYVTISVGDVLSTILCVCWAVYMVYNIGKTVFSEKSNKSKIIYLSIATLASVIVIRNYLQMPLCQLSLMGAAGLVFSLLVAYKGLDVALE